MSRHISMAVGALLILACDRQPRTPETASAYAADTIANTFLGTEFQAKPLIPAMQDQLRRLTEEPPAQRRDNLTAHKHQLAALTAAMEADLQRIGHGEIEALRALADSAADDLGGGTGAARDMAMVGADSAKLNQHIARVERIIALYERAVRAAALPTER